MIGFRRKSGARIYHVQHRRVTGCLNKAVAFRITARWFPRCLGDSASASENMIGARQNLSHRISVYAVEENSESLQSITSIRDVTILSQSTSRLHIACIPIHPSSFNLAATEQHRTRSPPHDNTITA
mmetsp:Transcript_46772/g.97895  ORF Transcript_46772/g.97895 Transcript_46772/m.97895 type:complete len:127 (-) Transcript_46772:112-492(-)